VDKVVELRKAFEGALARERVGEEAAPWHWKNVNLFGDVDDAARCEFFRQAERHDYKKGQHIFLSQDPANRVFYLDDGMVKIYNLSEGGDVSIHWFCVPGDLISVGAVCGGDTQMAFAQSVEPAKVFSIQRAAFERLLKAHSSLAVNVIRAMAARLQLLCESVTDISAEMSDRRLARLLLRLAENCGRRTSSGIELRAHITHQEFANMIGACRQTVTVTLQSFRDLGLIEITGRALTILAVEELRRFVDSPVDAGGGIRITAANPSGVHRPSIVSRRPK
jgi:CRP/FNR family cyclic AMP-dependent transcriptional regulator